ncbi:hypothetical protein AKJ51_02125 [candidate division MSBL1 archaeon SCGC-AAA382A20]|uniref:DUF3800 domain-containing protein n=1 Tax=candidate division MSBL1 archaeon SCGC-AAA382A20 TaxID=1698280 RepID=A0A133VKX3_9EURY|nr:hypothetical protein AKJ51_02125 [candidate division MSBL1 archaeon SCGC-AAA382A20]
MPKLFNIYCDESCHLENDDIPVMVLGAVWCPVDKVREISERVRELKRQHELLSPTELRQNNAEPFEIKWTKVSRSKADFYLSLVDYFFDDDDLHFRGVIIDKTILDHEIRHQSHGTWYYKMLFTLLKPIIDPEQRYHIYLDIKDTRSEEKKRKLQEVLQNSKFDRVGFIIKRLQQIRSHESEIMQLTDLFIGAVGYCNRICWGDLADRECRNEGKIAIINRIQKRSGKDLTQSTWLLESKVNLLRWEPKELDDEQSA